MRLELNNRQLWIALGSIVAAASLVLWLSPAERTLGNGIKSVYAHVGLTWTGMTAIAVAGLLGFAATVWDRPLLHTWLHAIGRAGALFFAFGYATSLLSARINWGGVFWGEPRLQASLKVVLASVLVLIVAGFVPSRFRGLLYLALSLFMMITITHARLVMHPRNPIGLSSSASIKWTFACMYVLMLAAALVIAAVFHRREKVEPRKT